MLCRIGWFPVLFYTSVWVSDLYKLDAKATGATLSEEALYDEATRAGSRALFFNAAVSFITAVFLPMVIAPFAGDNGSDDNDDGLNRRLRDALAQAGLPRWLVPRVPFRWATLGMVWMISHAVFSAAMFATLLVTTVAGANVVISSASRSESALRPDQEADLRLPSAVVGFCWGVSMFAPFALLGELILADSSSQHGGGSDAYALRSQSSVSLRRPPSRSRSRPQSRRTSEDSSASATEDGEEWHEAEGLMRKSGGRGHDGRGSSLPTLPPSPPLSSGPSSRSSSESSDYDGQRHKVEIRYSNSTLSLPRRTWPSSERVDDDGEGELDGGPSEDAFAADLEGPRKGGGTAEKAGVILVSRHEFSIPLSQI